VQFDSQQQDKTALDKRAEFEDLVQQIRQKRAELGAARVKDESEVAQAENAVKTYELEILKNEMLSRVKAEKNDQDLAEAKSKPALRKAFELSTAAAELRILEIKRDRAKADMEHTLENADDGVPRSMASSSEADVAGQRAGRHPGGRRDVARRPRAAGGESGVDAGQGTREPGRPAARALGRPVTVLLDAYPDLRMPGRIERLAPIALNGSFPRGSACSAVVSIAGSSARLLPDLTAALDVGRRVSNALVVPRTAVQRDGSSVRVRVRRRGTVA
jgi:hypothetical protein